MSWRENIAIGTRERSIYAKRLASVDRFLSRSSHVRMSIFLAAVTQADFLLAREPPEQVDAISMFQALGELLSRDPFNSSKLNFRNIMLSSAVL